MKAPYTMDALGHWPPPDCLHLALIHLDPFSSDYIPQEYDLLSQKGTLLEIPMQFILLQNLNNLREMNLGALLQSYCIYGCHQSTQLQPCQ